MVDGKKYTGLKWNIFNADEDLRSQWEMSSECRFYAFQQEANLA